MTAYQPNAPCQRLAPASCHSGPDQRIQHLAFRQAQPGHNRDGQGREKGPFPADLHAPGHLPAEAPLGLLRDSHALISRLLAEALHPAPGRCRLAVGDLGDDVRVVEAADDQDLVVVCFDFRRSSEPSLRQPAQHPAPDLVVCQFELHSYRLRRRRI